MNARRRASVVALSLGLAFALALSLAPNAFADFDGTYEYTISDGQATITDCLSSETGALVIPSTLGGFPVAAIGDGALAHSNPSSVAIPEGVTTIGKRAFSRGGSELTAVGMPSSLTTIGPYAFAECSLLTNAAIPSGVTSIGEGAFTGCGITAVAIPPGTTYIYEDTFSRTKLASVTIPYGVSYIAARAFASVPSLASP